MRVLRAGPIHENGGTLYFVEGAPPNALISWALTGPGTLTPLSDSTDDAGFAVATYSATAGTPAVAGNTVLVEVSAYGP